MPALPYALLIGTVIALGGVTVAIAAGLGFWVVPVLGAVALAARLAQWRK